MTNDARLLKKVAEIYNRLDLQICESADLTGVCQVCGKCCDFDAFDHHLFVTPPELMYLSAKLGMENLKRMTTSRCPYNINGKCTIYKYRFVSCRIFCCRGDADFQSRLSESALGKLKSLCVELQIPYRYTDLASTLNNLTG